MKKLLALIPVLLFSVILMAQPPKVAADKGTVFGAKVTEEGAVSADLLAENLTVTGQTKEVKITGVVKEVCKAEGCWVRMETKEGSILVKMKDHAFLVPVALEGKTIVADGVATFKETSVEQLRHFAEDAGKTKNEIAEITEPKKEIVFQATGIKVL
ncbi:MAG TPA: DUF4920 domain-containing protein [Ferruginibacter sp.]|nr:DUF4920 domain-containing protein [Ferruginibacter sp.]